MNNSRNNLCSVCKKDLHTYFEKKFNIHFSCNHKYNMEELEDCKGEINRTWEICCPKDNPSYSIIQTSLNEFLFLGDKMNKFWHEAVKYKQSIWNEPNRLELLRDYNLQNDYFLKPELLNLIWVMYREDWKDPLRPNVIEKLCSLLELNLKAEDIYGIEKVKYFEKGFLDKTNSSWIPYQMKDYPLVEQQEKLKYRLHYVAYEDTDSNGIIISDKPIDHITANLLNLYYRTCLSVLEREYIYDLNSNIFFHDYHPLLYEALLNNEEFFENQKKEINNV